MFSLCFNIQPVSLRKCLIPSGVVRKQAKEGFYELSDATGGMAAIPVAGYRFWIRAAVVTSMFVSPASIF